MPRQHHPYADVFPMMAEAELERLVEDMGVNGYDDRLPIATLDGKILDGRNRWKVAQQAEVTPSLVEYEGNDPLAFVVLIT